MRDPHYTINTTEHHEHSERHWYAGLGRRLRIRPIEKRMRRRVKRLLQKQPDEA